MLILKRCCRFRDGSRFFHQVTAALLCFLRMKKEDKAITAQHIIEAAPSLAEHPHQDLKGSGGSQQLTHSGGYTGFNPPAIAVTASAAEEDLTSSSGHVWITIHHHLSLVMKLVSRTNCYC